jgi:hypothetical protein
MALPSIRLHHENRPEAPRRVTPWAEKRGSMLYIIEVAVDAGNLARELSQMRTWLDHMKFQAVGFRQIPGANICRVDFEGEQEAAAFAKAFGGRVLNSTAP